MATTSDFINDVINDIFCNDGKIQNLCKKIPTFLNNAKD